MAICKKHETEPGCPGRLGVNQREGGYNFAVVIPDETEASLLLYRGGEEPVEEIPLPAAERAGWIASVKVLGLDAEKYRYNYRIKGKVVQDPYAKKICGREHFGKPLDEKNPHEVQCGIPGPSGYDWEGDKPVEIPYEEMLLYKLHVRGYTKQASVKHKGTFAGLQEMIPYLKDLGVNALELMPAYEFMEMPRKTETQEFVSPRQEQERVNYWGYVEGFYFCPKRSYCATREPEKEVKDLVKALHREKMECIMEFYFPGEVSPLLALEALRFWRSEYHIDGFHLLGDGVPVELILKDPLLCTSKLMLPGFDTERIYGRKIPEKRNLAEYNQGFQQDMRRFLKSDENMVGSAAYRIRRNPATHGVINYMASQDGFTLYDCVSYDTRHNEANGENNRDGSAYNCSWNCGVEGPTRKRQVVAARKRQMKNAFLMMLLSQGTPMIYAGDEIANSQEGNNNAWCQDNPTGWVNWKNAKKNGELREFVKKAAAFRKSHPILHTSWELKGLDYMAVGYPDMSLHSGRAWFADFDCNCRELGVMYAGSYAEEEGFLYVAYNFRWEEGALALPNLEEGMIWVKAVDTSLDESFPDEPVLLEDQKVISVPPRTILVLQGKTGVIKKDECVETL